MWWTRPCSRRIFIVLIIFDSEHIRLRIRRYLPSDSITIIIRLTRFLQYATSPSISTAPTVLMIHITIIVLSVLLIPCSTSSVIIVIPATMIRESHIKAFRCSLKPESSTRSCRMLCLLLLRIVGESYLLPMHKEWWRGMWLTRFYHGPVLSQGTRQIVWRWTQYLPSQGAEGSHTRTDYES